MILVMTCNVGWGCSPGHTWRYYRVPGRTLDFDFMPGGAGTGADRGGKVPKAQHLMSHEKPALFAV